MHPDQPTCGKADGNKELLLSWVLSGFADICGVYCTALSCIDHIARGAFHTTFGQVCSSAAIVL